MNPGLEHYKEKWAIESEQNIKPGLDAILGALKLVGNPHEELKVVHLAGTNGKGSTLTFLDSIAKEHGLVVGKFMSPCIIDIHDQIQVGGVSISEKQLDAVFEDIRNAGISKSLTDFELLTLAAFMHFQREDVDIVLLESGMGGREDSTNVVTPIVSIIPSIALEHTNFLGTTLEAIAGHKAGIIKRNRPVVVGQLDLVALQVVKNEAKAQESTLLLLGDQFDIARQGRTETYTNHKNGVEIKNLVRKMAGSHQSSNMALAITAFFEVATALAIPVDVACIQKGVAAASLAGRFEEVLPGVFFDGAHNPASAVSLIETIKEQLPHKEIQFVVGMLGDKDVRGVLSILEQVSCHFTFIDFNNSRAMKATELMDISKASHKVIVEDIINYLRKQKNEESVIIVTGSLYLLSILRNQLVI